MPFGVKTAFERFALPKPEILKYPLETNVIDSAVISASGVTADASGPYKGRRYLLAGTILVKNASASGAANQYAKYAGTGTIAGVLFDTIEFADNSQASDEPAAFLRRNVSFNKDRVVGYATASAALATALPTCEFL